MLRNLLPNLLDDISEVMVRQEEGKESNLDEEKCEEIIKESIDHGRHRATSSQYTVKQMIREYIILKQGFDK